MRAPSAADLIAAFAFDVLEGELGVPLHVAQAQRELIVVRHLQLVELTAVGLARAGAPVGTLVGARVFSVQRGYAIAQAVGVQVAPVITVGAARDARLAVAKHIQFKCEAWRDGDFLHVVVAVDPHARPDRQALVAHFVLCKQGP